MIDVLRWRRALAATDLTVVLFACTADQLEFDVLGSRGIRVHAVVRPVPDAATRRPPPGTLAALCAPAADPAGRWYGAWIATQGHADIRLKSVALQTVLRLVKKRANESRR